MRKLRVRSTDKCPGRHGQILSAELLLLSATWLGDDSGASALGGICERGQVAHRMVCHGADLSEQCDDFGSSAEATENRQDSGCWMRLGETAPGSLLLRIFKHEWCGPVY